MNHVASTDMLLRCLCLSTMGKHYEPLAEKAEKESWGYTQYLRNLCEVELCERGARRVERRLKQSGLPDGKTMGQFFCRNRISGILRISTINSILF